MVGMHTPDAEMARLASKALLYSIDRIRVDPPPLGAPRPYEELLELVGQTITPEGITGAEALRLFIEVLAPSSIAVDHPKFLSFVPGAPTEASIIFDMVVSAASIYAGSWLEGAGAVFAENQALRWIADLAEFPESAGGVFVSGGTAGNMSALIAGRYWWRERNRGRHDHTRGLIMASQGAHSSVTQAARAMDADVLLVPADDRGRLVRSALRSTVDSMSQEDRDRLFAIVATCGTTNLGVIDDLSASADVAQELNVWFHVDGAYGAAGLCAPSIRDKYIGIERADSFIVDPHKWLFAPYDACALVYRNPQLAREVHTQHASYLESLHDDSWSPSDYGIQLTRRVRGLPFWFSLAAYGTDAYTEAMELTLTIAKQSAELVRKHPKLELLCEPELSIVAFTRTGWSASDYQSWSDKLLFDQIGFIPPSSHKGQPILRFAIVNPWTKISDIEMILSTL